MSRGALTPARLSVRLIFSGVLSFDLFRSALWSETRSISLPATSAVLREVRRPLPSSPGCPTNLLVGRLHPLCIRRSQRVMHRYFLPSEASRFSAFHSLYPTNTLVVIHRWFATGFLCLKSGASEESTVASGPALLLSSVEPLCLPADGGNLSVLVSGGDCVSLDLSGICITSEC